MERGWSKAPSINYLTNEKLRKDQTSAFQELIMKSSKIGMWRSSVSVWPRPLGVGGWDSWEERLLACKGWGLGRGNTFGGLKTCWHSNIGAQIKHFSSVRRTPAGSVWTWLIILQGLLTIVKMYTCNILVKNTSFLMRLPPSDTDEDLNFELMWYLLWIELVLKLMLLDPLKYHMY
jgi:hypothetical protein